MLFCAEPRAGSDSYLFKALRCRRKSKRLPHFRPTMRRKSESTGILGRGSACLSCRCVFFVLHIFPCTDHQCSSRRRKLVSAPLCQSEFILIPSSQKCTGTRPVCEQCTQMKRTHECQYDDTSKKSRTQILREKVAVLEAKLRDLEEESNLSNFFAPIYKSLPVNDHLSSPMIHHQGPGPSTFPLDHRDDLSDVSSSHGRIGTPMGDIRLPSYSNSNGNGTSPSLSLTDSSGGDSSIDQIFEPIVSLSAEMQNMLYVVHKYYYCAPIDCFKAFKLLSDIIGNAVFIQTLADSPHHHLLPSFNVPQPILPS